MGGSTSFTHAFSKYTSFSFVLFLLIQEIFAGTIPDTAVIPSEVVTKLVYIPNSENVSFRLNFPQISTTFEGLVRDLPISWSIVLCRRDPGCYVRMLKIWFCSAKGTKCDLHRQTITTEVKNWHTCKWYLVYYIRYTYFLCSSIEHYS